MHVKTLHLKKIRSSPQKLQMTFQHKAYIIIDKASMLGQKTFSWVDKRLRQATGALHEPLGGVSVSLFGDIAQLPPVAERPLFAKSSIVVSVTLCIKCSQ